MNKQSLNKLSLFLTGISQRIIDNKEYFKEISVVFKSGTKEFPAKIHMEHDKLKLNFNGNVEVLESDWLPLRIVKHGESYDSIIFTYMERGNTIIIEGDNKNVKMRTGESTEIRDVKSDIIKSHSESPHISSREYLVKVGPGNELLREIGILGSNGKIKNDMIRKYNQIDHFVELVDDIVKKILDEYGTITILDCACGKSYLSFVLNYYIREVLKKPCHFIGLDYSNTVIQSSIKMAQNLGYNNMTFKVTDIKNYYKKTDIHMVISLHACNTATDEAIALGVNNNVKSIVAVPCCHKELLSQYSYDPFEQILKHGILKARMADILTDGVRSLILEALGYKVSVVEYVSPVETPKNLMIKAYKTQEKNHSLLEKYRQLKELLGINPTLESLIFQK